MALPTKVVVRKPLPWQRKLALAGAFFLVAGMLLPFFKVTNPNALTHSEEVKSHSLFVMKSYGWGTVSFNAHLAVIFTWVLLIFAWLRPAFRLGAGVAVPLFLYVLLCFTAAFNLGDSFVGAYAYVTAILVIGVALFGELTAGH